MPHFHRHPIVGALALGWAMAGSGCGRNDAPAVGEGDSSVADATAIPCALDISIASKVATSHPLAHVRKWEYVIQQQTSGGKIARLAASDVDLVVIDDPATMTDSASYNAAADVAALHATRGQAGKTKIVLAYVDIGEAESYRTYWQSSWSVGNPSWIVASDPDGWSGNYPVAYWDPTWQSIVETMVNRVVADGYDGIYMDWVEAASFSTIVSLAQTESKDPLSEMANLVGLVRGWARAKSPSFLVVAQNAVGMRSQSGYLALLDGEAQEQVFFDGAADVHGTDPRQGDCRLPLHMGDLPPATNASYCASIATMRASSEEYAAALSAYLGAGIPVLMVDYALVHDNAAFSYAQSRCLGFVGLVKMRSLEDLSATPP